MLVLHMVSHTVSHTVLHPYQVDPNTGLQYTGGEPLTTLKQFRQHDK